MIGAFRAAILGAGAGAGGGVFSPTWGAGAVESDTTSSVPVVVDYPTHSDGDLLVILAVLSTATNTLMSISGWTKVDHDPGTNVTASVYYKTAGASEPSTASVYNNGTARPAGAIMYAIPGGTYHTSVSAVDAPNNLDFADASNTSGGAVASLLFAGYDDGGGTDGDLAATAAVGHTKTADLYTAKNSQDEINFWAGHVNEATTASTVSVDAWTRGPTSANRSTIHVLIEV